jgi:hypothetical protein
MPVLPATPIVKINLTQGASFGTVMVLGTGQLGFAELGTVVPDIVDVSADTLKISTRRERNVLQDKYLAATATVRVNDPNGYFNPQNTASPYYPDIQPLRKIQIQANYNGTLYPIFAGYITEFLYTFPQNQETGFVDLICYDAFRLFYNSNVTTVTGATAGQDTGTRIGKILDMVAWPNSQRSIDTGNTTCQVDPGGTRTVLDACQTVEFTEGPGAFYIDRAGNAVFKNRTYCYNAQSLPPVVFNNDGTTPINYSGIKFSFDDKAIVNKATVTPIGLAAQTYSDATSIAAYFTRAITAENMLMQTTGVALSLATAYVGARKDAVLTISSITLDLVTLQYTTGVAAALDLDYFDTMQITNYGQSTSVITKTLQCQGIAHDITANSWDTTLTTQEALIDANY